MGALPKNKITRVERGKRRAGNRPTLVQDLNTKVGQHKQGFVAQFLTFMGLGNAPVSSKSAAPKAKKAATTTVAPAKTAAIKPKMAAPAKSVKASRGTSGRRSGTK